MCMPLYYLGVQDGNNKGRLRAYALAADETFQSACTVLELFCKKPCDENCFVNCTG